MYDGIPRLGTWSQPGQTQTAGTAIKIPIPPFAGPAGSSPLIYALPNGAPNWMRGGGVTHVSQMGVFTGATAHIVYVMRPLNYAIVTVAGAINTTAFTIGTDPGSYSTAYKYPLPGSLTAPGNVANNLIAANDFFAVQLSDGSWFFDKVSSVTTLAITTTTTIPNVTGGGIPVGSVMFWFGIQTDTDPATGLGHPAILPPVSLYTNFIDTTNGSIACGLRPGDPLYLLDANATAADVLCSLSGFFGKY